MESNLAYSRYGDGAPLVLLHGNGENQQIWDAQIAALSAIRLVYTVDTRGHGDTPRGTAPFTLAQFAADLSTFLDQHALSKVDLLGFSDGGNIALLFSLQHPERINRLIVCGANLYPTGMKPMVYCSLVAEYVRLCLISLFSSKATHKRDLFALMVREPHIRPSRLNALPFPTLVIAGSHDIISNRHTRRIATSFPNAALRILSGGHMLPCEQPEAFNAVVLDFLSSETRM